MVTKAGLTNLIEVVTKAGLTKLIEVVTKAGLTNLIEVVIQHAHSRTAVCVSRRIKIMHV